MYKNVLNFQYDQQEVMFCTFTISKMAGIEFTQLRAISPHKANNVYKYDI